MYSLPAFYYPLTIAWIDDNALFLDTISQLLRPTYSIQAFNCPKTCLQFFTTYSLPTEKKPFLYPSVDHEYYATVNHAPVDLNVTELHTVLSNPDRKKEI